jgi:GT2 family glycosyltransferase
MISNCEVLTPLGGAGPTVWMNRNRKLLNGYEWETSEIKGIGNARNDLLRKSEKSLVFWLDSDIELDYDPVPILYNVMQKFNVSGVSAGQLTVGNKWFLKVAGEMDKLDIERHSGIKIVEARAFQCALFKREDMVKAGGFDPFFDTAGEDNDLVRRMISKGMLILQYNGVIVKHHVDEKNYWKKFKKYREGFTKLTFTMKEGYQPETLFPSIDFGMFMRMPILYALYKAKEKIYLIT